MVRFSCNLIFMPCPPPHGLLVRPHPCKLTCTKLVKTSWGHFGNPPVPASPLQAMLILSWKRLLGGKPLRRRAVIDSSITLITRMPLSLILMPASAGLAARYRAALTLLILILSGAPSGPQWRMLSLLLLKPTAPLPSSFGAEPRNWSGSARPRSLPTGFLGKPFRATCLTGSLASGGRPTDASGLHLC